MSATVICHGCGQSFPVEEGYRRDKIQCPGCGVICPVPESSGKAAAGKSAGKGGGPAPGREAPPDRENEAADFLRDNEFDSPRSNENDPEAITTSPGASPPARRKPRRARPPVPKVEESDGNPHRPPPKPVETWYNCRRCGGKVRRQGECPSCDGPQPTSDESAPAVPNLSLDEEPVRFQDEEDASPYETADRDLPICPSCKKQ